MTKIIRRRGIPILGAAIAMILIISACSSGSDDDTRTGPGGFAPINASFETFGLGQILPPGSSQQLGIWVDGLGSVSVEPDVATLSFGVEARADTVVPATAEAAQAMTDVLNALRAAGVRDDDIKTTSFQIQPIIVFTDITRDGVRERQQEIVGYRVTNQATAKIRNLDAVGAVIDAAAEAGGDTIRINGIGFSVDDPKPFEVQARDLAVEDAIAKAEQIARAANVSLGKPVFISQQGGAPLTREFAVAVQAFDSSVRAPTPIIAGDQDIVIRVQMVFAIE